MYIKFHRRKTVKRKVLAKQTDSCKIKFLKKCYIKIYLYYNHYYSCFAVDLLSFINISRYAAHCMTLLQSIIWIDNLKNYLLLRLKRNQLKIICFYFFFEFFTNHGDINAELITITKNSLLNELPHMTVHRKVNVHHKRIIVARKALIFAYFSAQLCQTLFEINKLNLRCFESYKFL